MDLSSSSFLLLIILLSLFLLNLKKSRNTSKSSSLGAKLPPGPPKLPIIGNLHHLAGSLPHHSFLRLTKSYGPLMYLKLGEIPTVVASSPDVAREIMKTHDINFSSRPEILAAKIMIYGAADLLFAPYGDYWRQLRKLCVIELLSAKRVQSFSSIREEEVSKLVRNIYAKSSSSSAVNISEQLHCLTTDVIAKAAFGSKCKDQETYISAMAEALKFGGGFCLADLFPSFPVIRFLSGIDFKLARCHQKIDRILNSIIKEHKMMKLRDADDGGSNESEENMLGVLLSCQEKGGLGFPLTTTRIKALIFDVFQASSGSAASAMSWAMAELIKNPRVMKRAQGEVREAFKGKSSMTERDIGELNYLKLVIKEVLRLHPPAPLLVPRMCTSATEINGYLIPEKTRVIINAWAIGRDPQYWEDAEEFKPERFEGSKIDYKGSNFEYIPFGAGRRMCPGILFGLASMELPLAQLLYYFDWSLPAGMSPEDLDMSETAGLAARRKKDLFLCAAPCVPLP